MPSQATYQFRRDLRTEHLSSTTVEMDAVAVLFSWTDQEGRGYEVVHSGPDQLVASVSFDEAEQDTAIGDLDTQCSALGLVREPVAMAHGGRPAYDGSLHAPTHHQGTTQ